MKFTDSLFTSLYSNNAWASPQTAGKKYEGKDYYCYDNINVFVNIIQECLFWLANRNGITFERTMINKLRNSFEY